MKKRVNLRKNINTAMFFINLVVSVGANPTFKVNFTPLENIRIVPRLSFYVINICLYLAKTLHFFGSRFFKTMDMKSRTKIVESFRHCRIILQWSKNDFKSMISTNGDYYDSQNVRHSQTWNILTDSQTPAIVST